MRRSGPSPAVLASVLAVAVSIAGIGLLAVATSTGEPAAPSLARAAPAGQTSVPGADEGPPGRVLLLGDSVMFDAAPAIESTLRAGGVASVVDASVLGLGLTRDRYHDWRSTWSDLVATHRPDAVVVLLAPFDLNDLATSPTVETWTDRYQELVAEAGEILDDAATVLWVASPGYADPALDAGVAQLNDALRRAGGSFEVLDVGRLDPTDPALRKDDGVHLCPAGAESIAVAVAGALDLDPARSVDDAWRDDERYATGLYGTPC